MIEEIYRGFHEILMLVADIDSYVDEDEIGLAQEVAKKKRESGIELSEKEEIYLNNLVKKTTDLQSQLIVLRRSFDNLNSKLTKEFNIYNNWK